jgi:TolB-like protein/DNA-binding winged helix-turn-helix (wHTH) protein/Flp pilus assembly protein TadD
MHGCSGVRLDARYNGRAERTPLRNDATAIPTRMNTASPRAPNSAVRIYRVGDLRVDVGQQRVTRVDAEISLPKLSFDLLLALIRTAPDIISSEELMTLVWPGLVVSPETVSQRIKLLRDALSDDPRNPRYITVLRGRGYRLIGPVADGTLEHTDRIVQPDPGSAMQQSVLPARTVSDTKSAQPVPAAQPQAVPPRRAGGVGKRGGVAAAVLVAAGAVVVLGLRYWSSSHNAAQPATVAMVDESIAVLPFVDMSDKKDQEYFGDGMAEEIIDLLGKIPGLRVIGRTSSFQFKNKTEDLRSIGTQLGVAYLLEGSVRKSGDRMRVTAQLIDSRNGTRRWSQTYDRDLGDILKMQDEIATDVVQTVDADLWASEGSGRTPRNAEAYAALLQGMQAGIRGDPEQAVIDYQRALDLDPTYAGAASALAGEYLSLESPEKAGNAAKLALKLDPNQSVAHSVLAHIHIVYDWDWPAAERELELARALAPRDSVIWYTSAKLSLTMGRWDDALKFVNTSMAVEPLNPQSYFQLSITQLRRGRLEEAEAAIRRTLELSPTYSFAHYRLALVLLARSEPEAALVESLKEPIEEARLNGSALAYSALRAKSDSDKALTQALKIYTSPTGIAAVYAFRGESDEAFKWLDRAYEQKDPPLYRIKVETEFDGLHGDPRYKAFLKRMNLPE